MRSSRAGAAPCHPRPPPRSLTDPTHAGISLKTQELYALVFVCRYLDLFYSFISV